MKMASKVYIGNFVQAVYNHKNIVMENRAVRITLNFNEVFEQVYMYNYIEFDKTENKVIEQINKSITEVISDCLYLVVVFGWKYRVIE